MSIIKDILVDLYNDAKAIIIEKFSDKQNAILEPVYNDSTLASNFSVRQPQNFAPQCHVHQIPVTQISGTYQNNPGNYTIYAPFVKSLYNDYTISDWTNNNTFISQYPRISQQAQKALLPEIYDITQNTSSASSASSAFSQMNGPVSSIYTPDIYQNTTPNINLPSSPSPFPQMNNQISPSLASQLGSQFTPSPNIQVSPSIASFQNDSQSPFIQNIQNTNAQVSPSRAPSKMESTFVPSSSFQPIIETLQPQSHEKSNIQVNSSSMILPDGRVMIIPSYEKDVIGIYDPCTDSYNKISANEEISSSSSVNSAIPIYFLFNVYFPTIQNLNQQLITTIIKVYNMILLYSKINGTITLNKQVDNYVILYALFPDGNINLANLLIKLLPKTQTFLKFIDPKVYIDTITPIQNGMPINFVNQQLTVNVLPTDNVLYLTFILRFPSLELTTFNQSIVTTIIEIYNNILSKSRISGFISLQNIYSGSVIFEFNAIFTNGNNYQAVQFKNQLPKTLSLLTFIDEGVSIQNISQIMTGLPIIIQSNSKTSPSSQSYDTALPPSNQSYGGSPPPDQSYGGSPPPSSQSYDTVPSPSSQSYGGSPPPDQSYGGSPPPSSQSYHTAPPPSSQSYGGSPPPSSQSYGGSPPPSSQSYGGSPPPSSQSYGGSPPPDQSYGGSPPLSSQSYGDSPPPSSQSYGGSPPPDQSYDGSPPSNQSYDGSPPSNQSYGGSPPPDQSYGASPTTQQYVSPIADQSYRAPLAPPPNQDSDQINYGIPAPSSSYSPIIYLPPPSQVSIVSKKGFVVGNNDTVGGLKVNSLIAKWYYTWGATPVSPGPNGLLFTPMIWNISKTPNVNAVINSFKTLNIPGQENVLLTYNEPDGINASAQGNMLVSQAVEYWPQIVATNRRLGSPVMYGSLINVTSDPPGTGKNINNMPQPTGITGPVSINISNTNVPNMVLLNPAIWLDNFLIQVSQDYQNNPEKYTVRSPFPDFICIHWYGNPVASAFLSYLQNIYNKYHLPLWITEYSVADWNATWNTTANTTKHTAGFDWSIPTSANIQTNATAQFMAQTIAGMNNMPFVERYSWKERYLLSPYGTEPSSSTTPPALQLSIEGPTNIDYMNQSALFNSYVHFPTTLPSLTPLGQLYASL